MQRRTTQQHRKKRKCAGHTIVQLPNGAVAVTTGSTEVVEMLKLSLPKQRAGREKRPTHPGVGPEALLRQVFHAVAKRAPRVGAHVLVLEHGLGRLAVGELARFPAITILCEWETKPTCIGSKKSSDPIIASKRYRQPSESQVGRKTGQTFAANTNTAYNKP